MAETLKNTPRVSESELQNNTPDSETSPLTSKELKLTLQAATGNSESSVAVNYSPNEDDSLSGGTLPVQNATSPEDQDRNFPGEVSPVPGPSQLTQYSTDAGDVEDTITPSESSIFSDAPTAPKNENVSSEDENVLKYFIILRPTGPTATILAKVCTTLYGGAGKSVKDFFTQDLGNTHAQYKKTFTAHERDILEKRTSWESCDITFLYKVLQRVCGLASPSDKKWAEPTASERDDVEHMLYRIKCERNFLAHEAITLTNNELKTRSEVLKTLLESILSKVGIWKGIDFVQDVKTTKTKIDEVLNSSSKYSVQSYREELEKLRNDVVNNLVSNSQSELNPYYHDLWASAVEQWFKIPNADDDSSSHETKIFTKITLKDVNNAVLSVEDIFTYRNSNGDHPRVSIIEGIAGIGKSYICKYILHKWATGKGADINLQGVDIIIFIQCHTVNSKNLREFLMEELLPNTCSNLRKEDVIPALQKCCVVFVIDGIDEAGSNARYIMRELSSKFSKTRKILTCRPEFTEEAKKLVLSKGKDTIILYAKGFDNSQRKEYLGKLLKMIKGNADDQEGTIKRLYKRLEEVEHHPLLCLPLTLMLLVSLWLDDDDSLSQTNTVMRIYQKTVEMKLCQLALRTQRRPGESRHPKIIENSCHQWLMALSKIAWETLRCKTQILDSRCTTELITVAQNDCLDPMDALSCFMKCITLQKMFSTDYAWEFFHKTFQEYLAALYMDQNQAKILEISETLPSKPQQPSEWHVQMNDKAFPQEEIKRKRAFGVKSFLNSLVNKYTVKRKCKEGMPKRRNIFPKIRHKTKSIPSKDHVSPDRIFYGVSEEESFRGISIQEKSGSSENRENAETLSSEDESAVVGGSEYESTLSVESESLHSFDYEPEHVDEQNTTLFLAAMETSKAVVNTSYMERIIYKYKQGKGERTLDQWATFLRECHEHPTVCKILQRVLYGIIIKNYISDPSVCEYIETVEYLLRIIRFQPSRGNFWFIRDEPLPKGFGHLLLTMLELSPGTPIDITCNYDLSSDLLLCLNPLPGLDKVQINLAGKIQKKNMNGLISLLKYLDEKDATIQMDVMIEEVDDLRNYAYCSTLSPLPRKMKLNLRFFHASKDMLTPLTQVLKAYRWQKPFSLAFQDARFCEETKILKELLRDALHNSSVKLTNMELLIEACAEYHLKEYEEMAHAIAEDIPCAVIVEGAAAGDDINLHFDGVMQN